MSDLMAIISFESMINWILSEYKNENSVFGISKDKFYRNSANDKTKIFGEKVSSIIGPAAGPHSQLTQNIVASYLTGSRVIELKTVQTLDGEDIRVLIKKPCINATDEGYNTEWSTELSVNEALEEYIKAHFLISVFAKEFNLADEKDFVFNMSVGYDYEGITSEKIDTFIEGLKDCKELKIYKDIIECLNNKVDSFNNVDKEFIENITTKISNSVTLSTLHGCKPSEIFKIANYLIVEKNLHTYVKCNPTLLGYQYAREILDNMGYSYISFDEHHFNNDLQYDTAIKIIKDLQNIAKDKKVDFGVKITNTFPVQIKQNELSGDEMYMSGRALFLLSFSIVKKLSDEFNSNIKISYSGGADYFNASDLALSGIRPITFATTILKPHGYERFNQLALITNEHIHKVKINKAEVDRIFSNMTKLEYYKKDFRPINSNRKTTSNLPLFDCFKAPCSSGGCPINQQIPEYLKLVSKKEYKKALEVILIDNPLPSITGAICNHNCQSMCTRVDIDEPLKIRNSKKIASLNAQDNYINDYKKTKILTEKRVCVIGAGPAGIASSIFLRRNGVAVDVYDKGDKPFGIVSKIIPDFRITEEEIERDYKLALAVGVNFIFNTEIQDINSIKKQYDFVIVAIGSWKDIENQELDNENVYGALEFLQKCKENNYELDLGQKVAIIGGGDVAMDCARAVKRVNNVLESSIIYRRTRDYIKAQREEVIGAEEDGVSFKFLLSPVSFNDGKLLVDKMELSDFDNFGRRSVIKTDKRFTLEYDSLILATGSEVFSLMFSDNGIYVDDRTNPIIDANNQTNIADVYVIGDCKKGSSTIVSGIADAKTTAKDILRKIGLENDFIKISSEFDKNLLYAKKGISLKSTDDYSDGDRCLECNNICEICVGVCPNRANIILENKQILHIDGMCNECGNCFIFCPHKDAPYKDKVTLFWDLESFKNSENRGFVQISEEEYLVRINEKEEISFKISEEFLYEFKEMIELVHNKYSYLKK